MHKTLKGRISTSSKALLTKCLVLINVNIMSLMNIYETINVVIEVILIVSGVTYLGIWAITDKFFVKEQKILVVNLILTLSWLLVSLLLPIPVLLSVAALLLSAILLIMATVGFLRDYLTFKSLKERVDAIEREVETLTREYDSHGAGKGLVQSVGEELNRIDNLINLIKQTIQLYEETEHDRTAFLDKQKG